MPSLASLRRRRLSSLRDRSEDWRDGYEAALRDLGVMAERTEPVGNMNSTMFGGRSLMARQRAARGSERGSQILAVYRARDELRERLEKSRP